MSDTVYTVAVRPLGGHSKRVGISHQTGRVRWYAKDITRGKLTGSDLAAVRKHFDRKWGAGKYKLVTTRVDLYPHLTGDTDCNPDLLLALERVARRLSKQHGRKITIHIRSGRRTLAEQQELWDRYGPPRAARPNPNAPHVRGVAADCGIDGVNIGAFPGARAAMKAENVCLRVPGENWHAERGTVWAA
jgi:hypothetical protein